MNIIGNIVDSVSSIFGGGSNNRNQSRDMNSQGDIYNQQQQAFDQYYHPTLNSFMQLSGYDPSTGQFNSSYDPYGDGTGNGLVSQYDEGSSGQYDNAVNEANHDLMARGYTGQNSLSGSVIGNIRNQQAQNNVSNAVQVGIDANNARYQRMGNALNSIMGAGQNSAQGYGQLAGQYANAAQQQTAGLTGLASAAGTLSRDPALAQAAAAA